MDLVPLPDDYARQRAEIQRVAVHVLARARHAQSGRFGLRSAPDGLATPLFGQRDEVLRIAGGHLLHEWRGDDGPHTSAMALDGSSLDALAAFAGITLDPSFSVGHDTPPIGDPAATISLGSRTAAVIGTWYTMGAAGLDTVIATHPDAAAGAVQLWPEHFDIATDLAAGRTRVNIGASAGDGFCAEPYVYVGPWDPGRPGDAAFWNAPFGATITYSELRTTALPQAVVVAFWTRGIALVAGS